MGDENEVTGHFINGKPVVWGNCNEYHVEQPQWGKRKVVGYSYSFKFRPTKGNRRERKRLAYAWGKLFGMKVSARNPRLMKKRRR